MNSKKHTRLNCELYFGVSSLNNSSLTNRFFPEDLPEEWRFNYYTNEFDLLLIYLSDLNLPSSLIQQGNNVLGDEIIEQITELTDDLEESVLCVFDWSKLSKAIQQQLYESQITADGHCSFINFDKLGEDLVIDHSMQLEWGRVLGKESIEGTLNRDLFCHVISEVKIEAVGLRALIEHLRDYALANDARTMGIVFSSNYALENCRNAILLESMM